MLLDLIRHLELKNLVILYYDDVDVMFWKNFVDSAAGSSFIPPQFIHLEREHSEYEIT